MAEIMKQLGFLWSSVHFRSTFGCDGLIHDGYSHCLIEFLIKMFEVSKVGCKYYVIFHLFPMILRLKKAKSWGEVQSIIRNVGFNYFKSILFMAFLVSILRAGLCINQHLPPKMILPAQHNFVLFSNISALSILFEDQSRRTEITSYVCAKAIRSAYIGLKRSFNWQWKNEATIMHMLLMSGLFYIYNHYPKMLKFRHLFEIILGQN